MSDKKPWYRKKRWWIAGAVVVIIAAAAGGGSNDKSNSSNNLSAPIATTPGGQDVYTVGQTAKTGDFEVTLLQVEDPYTASNSIFRPGEGKRFVGIELSLTNTSSRTQTF